MRLRFGALFLLALITPLQISAQSRSGPLSDLYRAQEGGLAHYSSADTTGGNADMRRVAPGETLVLVDHAGAGVVKRWWITIAPRQERRDPATPHRALLLGRRRNAICRGARR
jgi:hypothetical protein